MQAQPVDASMQLARRPICGTVMDQFVGPQDRVRKICGRCEMPTRLLHEKDSSLQRRFFYGQVWIFFIYIFGMLTRLPTQIKSSQQSLSRFHRSVGAAPRLSQEWRSLQQSS